MAFTSGLNPNVVKTDLDDVFFQEYNKESLMNYVTAASGSVFNQSTASNSAVQVETYGGITYWQDRDEEEDVHSSTPRITNKATYNVSAFADSVDIPKHFYDDNMHGSYEMMVRDFGEMARVTRDRNALKFFTDGFATNTTADGANIFSNSHTTISGGTVDNLATAALSATSLNAGIVALGEQQSQSGVVRGCVASVLMVPLTLYKTACELADSELRPNTANNEPNVFLTKYGIYVATSPHLGATATGVSGADAYWYLLADNHSMTRYVRKGLETDLVDYKFQRNNAYIYKGEFREVVGCQDYVGLYGSNGTT
tara:strand:+ start:676 stop:1614 length:939 start_codon:yes stop_codon:yes gene_type:complete